MANRHYAEIGDVWKHLPLAVILEREPVGEFWESHSGSATYPFDPGEARDYGARRVLSRAADAPAMDRSAYVRLLREHDAAGRYPGSPALAMALAPAARFHFCDTEPASLAGIRAEAARLGLDPARVMTHAGDGISTLAAELRVASDERAHGVLAHLDPYRPLQPGVDGTNTVELFWRLAARGARAVLWYGFDTMTGRDELLAAIAGSDVTSRDTPLWCGEMFPTFLLHAGRAPSSSFPGCGILCANLGPATVLACREAGEALASLYRRATVGDEPAELTLMTSDFVPGPGHGRVRSGDPGGA
jgi:23S rRNA (adenine2030-N6)-methyltransferase